MTDVSEHGDLIDAAYALLMAAILLRDSAVDAEGRVRRVGT